MIDVHGGPLIDGQCAVTWGVMAPGDDGPGQVHICREQVHLLIGTQSGKVNAHNRHSGPHRCDCGASALRDDATRVVCHHPINIDMRATTVALLIDGLPVCGVTVTGTDLVDYRGPRRLGRDQMRAQTILSVPCGHPTQRQAS